MGKEHQESNQKHTPLGILLLAMQATKPSGQHSVKLEALQARRLPTRLQGDAALHYFVEHASQLHPLPDLILLYGSRARGTAHPDSDYDLLIMLPDRKSPAVDALYDILQGAGTPEGGVAVVPRGIL